MSQFDALNNLSATTQYPPLLIDVGGRDGVVNAGEGISLASIRQSMNNGETLLHIREDEGHNPSSFDLETTFLWDRLTNKMNN